ncbi:MAG: hypothetical protein IT269_13770 [Saprospiraceae bacterium]|nr:hypothetical protein [Saprospiraceae bacterium]
MLIMTLSLTAATLCAQSQWQAIPNAPSNQGRFDDVFFVDSLHGWLGSSAGRIYRTTDGGVNWTQVYNSNYYFRSIEFYNQQIGYAGTLDKKLLRTTNGGTSWTDVSPDISPAPDAVCGIAIPDSQTVYVVGEWDTPGYVAKTADGGHNWTRQTLGKAMIDAFFIHRDTGFVTGQNDQGAVIYYTTDGGATWTEKFNSNVPGQYVWKIQRITPQVWVASIQTFNGGVFAKSTDGGMTWEKKTAPVPDMQGIGFATPEHGWVGGYIPGFYETFDGGDTWEYKDFGGNFNRFYFLSPTLAYASGESVYKFSPQNSSSTKASPTKPYDDGFWLKIAPNPSNGRFNVRYYLPVKDIIRISILSADGTQMHNIYHERHLPPGEYNFDIDATDLPTGQYFLGIQRNHGLYMKPWVKSE